MGETDAVSTGVRVEAPHSGREAQKRFPKLDLRDMGHWEWIESR